jgi:hypothetical protein
VEKLHQTMPESAEIYFYLGCIAAQFSEHDKAAGYFKAAKNMIQNIQTELKCFVSAWGMSSWILYNISKPSRAEKKA